MFFHIFNRHLTKISEIETAAIGPKHRSGPELIKLIIFFGKKKGAGQLGPKPTRPMPTRPTKKSGPCQLGPSCKTRPKLQNSAHTNSAQFKFYKRQLVPHFRGIEVCVFYHLLTARFAPRIKYPYPFVHCIQAWNPSLIKDIELLEQVQHRATKLIPEISHLPYHDRLKYLKGTATLTISMFYHKELYKP